MSRPTTGHAPPRRRASQSVLVGIAAGIVGVTVSRAVFGPDTAPIGIAVGGAALTVGALLTWRAPRRRRSAASARIPRTVLLRRRVHPVHWVSPVTGSVITMAAWAGVAHSSGSGWVQAVGALLGAFLIVGLAAPSWPAHRAQVKATVGPADARAGRPFDVTVVADRPVRIRPRFPSGPEQQSGGTRHGARTVVVAVTPERRGVIDAVVVEVASSAPFGLLWWARDVELTLPRAVQVAPRTGPVRDSPDTTDNASGDAVLRVPSGIGEPRSIRNYAPGDPRRAVHWPATSHAGRLMVRESERPTDDPVFVELVLPRDDDTAETEAERMMGVVTDHLSRGRSVVLATSEEAGRVVRPVSGVVDLGRRLARAVSA